MQQEKMHLVVFDIDGTLTATNKVDNECFVLAMQEVLQITDIDTDWTKYRNVTDQGCLEEIVHRHKRRYGTETELNRVKQRHLALLQERADSDAKLFRSIAGAHETIERLKMLPNVRIALATGAWLESAQIKLRTARFTMEGIPMATCNDSFPAKKSSGLQRQEPFRRLVLGLRQRPTWVMQYGIYRLLRDCHTSSLEFMPTLKQSGFEPRVPGSLFLTMEMERFSLRFWKGYGIKDL